ncbi:MAG: hypothetical protein K6T87_21945 [Roseiflexus sp.]|jgi:hypothetical protein|uniref:hypothetical protein n=1 Tax=Roseiflexus sp. TaxID=2562120 RepID=UPI0025EEF345|nr:hypothetical protein [Roseiflexus sp.]MCL6543223.1 hypothetical protein [Roseiflexus sp.]
MIRQRLDVFLTWAIALVCVVGGAVWQIDAASRQSVVIGGLNDRGYISGFHDREVSLSDGSPFRWAPPQGARYISGRCLPALRSSSASECTGLKQRLLL